jgi:hypothetical protein
VTGGIIGAMELRIRTWVQTLAVAGAVMIAMAGCNGGSGNGSPTPGPSTNPNDAQREAAFAYAKCMRDNGNPDFKDPTQDAKGGWSFQAGSGPPPAACLELSNKLRDFDRDADRISGADMAKLRQFAACMRKTYPEFPDPNSRGDFPMPPSLSERFQRRDGSRPEAPCEQDLPQGYKLSYTDA